MCLWKPSLIENCPVEQQVAETGVIVQSWLKIVVLLQRISVFSFFFDRRENRWFRISSGRYLNPCIVSISNLPGGLIWVFTRVQSTVLRLRRKKKPFYLNQKTPMWSPSYGINLLLEE